MAHLKKSARDLSNHANAIFIFIFFIFCPDFLYQSICYGYSIE